MLTKLFAIAAILIAVITIGAAYTQTSALTLRQEQQPWYWPRHGTHLTGGYRSGVWIYSPNRSSYDSFPGGGPSFGK